MKIIIFALMLYSTSSWSVESFIIQINDKEIKVESPAKVKDQYSVLIENKSTTKILGKFYFNQTNLKFISLNPDSSETVEFLHKNKDKVRFTLLNPPFQAVELIEGKRYVIPQ